MSEAKQPEVLKDIPIDRIARIRRDYFEKGRKLFTDHRSTEPTVRRAYGSIQKQCEEEVACELREWIADLVRPTIQDTIETIQTQGFNAMSQEHLSAVATVAAVAGKDVKTIQDGLKAVGEFSGVLKEGPNKGFKITGEQLGAVVARLMQRG